MKSNMIDYIIENMKYEKNYYNKNFDKSICDFF